MAETAGSCPVHQAVKVFKQILDKEKITHPFAHRAAEEAFSLLRDVAFGRAGDSHLPAIESLANEMADGPDTCARTAGQHLADLLTTQKEVFESHIATGNCATGDCVRLAPAPCQMTCPAGIDVPTYVTLVGMGRDAEAVSVIRKDNPFPWVCGLVCTRPCEFMCVRGRMDSPVAIKAIKAFAAERAMSDFEYKNPEKDPDTGKKVCVIGAGPAGMSAAYYLALKGHFVRIIEALPSAGGMMLAGIPRYRLPREVIDREAGMLEDLGVEFQFNTRFGKDVTLDDLKKEGFSAFFIAIGAHSSMALRIEGEDKFKGILPAVDFLRSVALGDRRKPGDKVVVVGGGNVAIDAARTSLRLGAKQVVVAYRRTRHEMPADIEEVEQAEEEGVGFDFLRVPIGFTGDSGKITGLECLRAELKQKPGSSRMSPVPIEGSQHVMEADAVIVAIGQQVDTGGMELFSGLKWSRRKTIMTQTSTMETDIEGVFAAGDAVTGPATVIEAIGGGKRAAMAIDRYLSGLPQPKMPPVPRRRDRLECLSLPATTKMALKRPEMPLLNIERRRTTFQQAELGMTEQMMREEARRCLRCDICMRCGTCVEVCRDKMGIDALDLGYLDFDHPVETDFRKTAEKCIACGACAANCPTGAMTLTDKGSERVLALCGTVLNRQHLVPCEECGRLMNPERYLNFIAGRTRQIASAPETRNLCENCLRKRSARFSVDHTPV